MRPFRIIVTLLVMIAPIQGRADSTMLHAGMARPSVGGGVPFEMLVWYPTEADEAVWQSGPFTMSATRNAAVAPGRFPVVLLSHGGGLGGGTPMILRDISVALARRGFVVVAPFHGKAGLQDRPIQMERALETVLSDPRFSSHVDPARLGIVGFSLGGAVALELAGAVPKFAHLVSYCAGHPSDVMSCEHAPGGNHTAPSGSSPSISVETPPPPLALKAVALLDPYAVLFRRPELAAVTMPVLIFRPSQSELPGEANAAGLAASLPDAPQVQTIPGSHFVFTDVCPPSLRISAPEVCEDPPGVDRTAVHTAVESQIIDFFVKNL